MPEGSPLTWSVADLMSAYASAELSPVEVARDALERIKAVDGELHAFITLDEHGTLAQAEESERRYRDGEARVLEGVPISVKDAAEVRNLNRKQRNKMAVVKEGLEVTDVILQEGVPTVETVNDGAAEPVVYMIDRYVVGGFYRAHAERGREIGRASCRERV